MPSGVTAKDAEFAAVKAAALRSPEFSPAEIADTIKRKHNVRYIAVTDGVDSLTRQEMDITPFKNIPVSYTHLDVYKRQV